MDKFQESTKRLNDICNEVWKEEKHKGVRNYQLISRIISQRYNDYIKTEHKIEIQEENLKSHENKIQKHINANFIQKLDKKYKNGLTSLIGEKDDEIGIVMNFYCEEKYFEKEIQIRDQELSLESFRERRNPEKNSEEWQKQINNFSEITEKSLNYLYHLFKVFDLNFFSQKFLKSYLKNMIKEKSEKFKIEFPKKHEFFTSNIDEIMKFENNHKTVQFALKLIRKDFYFEFTFGDFLLIFCKFLNFFSGLKIKIEIDVESTIFIKVYCPKEEYLGGYAESFAYEMQLKNYAFFYREFKKDLKQQEEAEENSLFIPNKDSQILQFQDFDHEDQIHFPPFVPFEKLHRDKFMKYTKNDLIFHRNLDYEYQKNQSPDSEFNSASNFRSIDKIRLIYRAFDEVLRIRFLKQLNYLKFFVFIRDFQAYKEQLEVDNLVWGKANIFNGKKQLEFVQTVRNFYGERIAFYFLWIIKFTLWSIFPAIIGVIVFIFQMTLNSDAPKKQGNLISSMDVIYFIYSFMLVGWASLFIKVWRQEEEKYSYFWGTENYSVTEAFDDNFQKDYNEDFIMGYKIPYQKRYKKVFKYILSYLAVAIICVLIGFISSYLFYLKDYYRNDEDENQFFLKRKSFWVGMATAAQIKVWSFVYSYIVVWLTDWENHEKLSYYDTSLSIKTVFFEFINNYFNLYYIAFFRTIMIKTDQRKSWGELKIQLYMQLFILFAVNFVELGLPFLLNYFKKRDFIKRYPAEKANSIDFTPHSIYHQIVADEYSSVRDDYNEIIIQFGYLTFFSIVAPLIPLICLFLNICERFVDIYKIFYLSHVSIIDGASGIGIYNGIFEIWYFIGMTTNIALCLFTNPNFNEADLTTKLLIFLICENSFLILMRLVRFNILPKWFEFKYLNLMLYEKRFYGKDYYTLPHLELRNKKLKPS